LRQKIALNVVFFPSRRQFSQVDALFFNRRRFPSRRTQRFIAIIRKTPTLTLSDARFQKKFSRSAARRRFFPKTRVPLRTKRPLRTPKRRSSFLGDVKMGEPGKV
jgi:hypothetical protein